MSTECAKTMELIWWEQNSLDGDRKEEIEAHLKECSTCGQHLENCRQLMKSLEPPEEEEKTEFCLGDFDLARAVLLKTSKAKEPLIESHLRRCFRCLHRYIFLYAHRKKIQDLLDQKQRDREGFSQGEILRLSSRVRARRSSFRSRLSGIFKGRTPPSLADWFEDKTSFFKTSTALAAGLALLLFVVIFFLVSYLGSQDEKKKPSPPPSPSLSSTVARLALSAKVEPVQVFFGSGQGELKSSREKSPLTSGEVDLLSIRDILSTGKGDSMPLFVGEIPFLLEKSSQGSFFLREKIHSFLPRQGNFQFELKRGQQLDLYIGNNSFALQSQSPKAGLRLLSDQKSWLLQCRKGKVQLHSNSHSLVLPVSREVVLTPSLSSLRHLTRTKALSPQLGDIRPFSCQIKVIKGQVYLPREKKTWKGNQNLTVNPFDRLQCKGEERAVLALEKVRFWLESSSEISLWKKENSDQVFAFLHRGKIAVKNDSTPPSLRLYFPVLRKVISLHSHSSHWGLEKDWSKVLLYCLKGKISQESRKEARILPPAHKIRFQNLKDSLPTPIERLPSWLVPLIEAHRLQIRETYTRAKEFSQMGNFQLHFTPRGKKRQLAIKEPDREEKGVLEFPAYSLQPATLYRLRWKGEISSPAGPVHLAVVGHRKGLKFWEISRSLSPSDKGEKSLYFETPADLDTSLPLNIELSFRGPLKLSLSPIAIEKVLLK